MLLPTFSDFPALEFDGPTDFLEGLDKTSPALAEYYVHRRNTDQDNVACACEKKILMYLDSRLAEIEQKFLSQPRSFDARSAFLSLTESHRRCCKKQNELTKNQQKLEERLKQYSSVTPSEF